MTDRITSLTITDADRADLHRVLDNEHFHVCHRLPGNMPSIAMDYQHHIFRDGIDAAAYRRSLPSYVRVTVFAHCFEEMCQPKKAHEIIR